MTMDYLNQSICLSDIPKESIRLDEKTGKKYLAITAGLMRQPDKNGNTYSVYVSQRKGEKKEDRVYLGKGRSFSFSEKTPSPESVGDMPQAEYADDLPF